MTDCVEELTTQHFRGRWHGFGPVKDREVVIFAAFQSTNCVGGRLTADSFDNKHLKTSAQSLARRAFVTRQVFDRAIVRDGALKGVAIANVSAIRALVADVRLNAGETSVRSLCVLDRVDAGDCDGHATAGYCEQQVALGMSQAQLSKVRARIRLDLADTFSEVHNADTRGWASGWSLRLKRALSVLRTALSFRA